MNRVCLSKNFERCSQCDELYCMNCSDAKSTGRFCNQECEDEYYSQRIPPVGTRDPRQIDKAQSAGVD